MSYSALQKPLALAGGALALYFGLRYLLPLILPFLLGAGLALAAEPLVRWGEKRVGLPRPAAAGAGVSALLLAAALLAVLVGRLALRELASLMDDLPDLEAAAGQALTALEDGLVFLADRSPEGVRPVLLRCATDLSGQGAAVLQGLVRRAPGAISGLLARVPDVLLALGTGVLSAFFFSARLPKLRQRLSQALPESWRQRLAALRQCRAALGGWLRTQVKLGALTMLISAAALTWMRVRHSLLWAMGIALVDAAPLLGSGTVLLPWSLVAFLEGKGARALGLLGTYCLCALTRSILEPKLLGRQLGIDPLATLAALYVGYRLLGVAGILLAPMAAVVGMALVQAREG